ncbi:MAG: hypothetical protein Q8L39_02225 [Burkholderiales bacterium]|nr:hypothetical protein [Burkholderiales bacterium]
MTARALPLYLPQRHPIPENEWPDKGQVSQIESKMALDSLQEQRYLVVHHPDACAPCSQSLYFSALVSMSEHMKEKHS